jgi:glucose/mannose transport system substrate-binding protein
VPSIAHGMAVSPALEGAIKDIVSQYWNDDRFTTAAAMRALTEATQKKR